jgi:hypothetical protein
MKAVSTVAVAIALLACAACGGKKTAAKPQLPSLEGGWRSRVTFTSGPFKGRPFQFLITYSAGGGMIESSNYDESPPVPPAYGSWGRTGQNAFKSTYIFWTTKPVAAGDAAKGWTFSGSGILSESITIAGTGDAYTSTISYQLYDTSDNPLPGQAGNGSATASRIIVG